MLLPIANFNGGKGKLPCPFNTGSTNLKTRMIEIGKAEMGAEKIWTLKDKRFKHINIKRELIGSLFTYNI
jgi:hypothetical protein|tara:strand:+ start:79 stop:288 length:210 start_codon:yes stop_codon:yes gene_type:complete